jgi:hypothetical protein
VWQPADQRQTVSNAVPTFCIQQGAAIEYDLWYVQPGSTMTVTEGAFGANKQITGSGADLTVTPAISAADGFVEISVKLAASVPLGQIRVLTLTDGTATLTTTIKAAEPYQIKDWNVSRATAAANMGTAAWIATHADTYSQAGVKGPTYNNEVDAVPSTAITSQSTDNVGVEAAAAQLAIWQVLAGKNVVAGVPEANSPIASYAATVHNPADQTVANNGTFFVTPQQANIDTAVTNRAKELFIAATGDGILGGADDKVAAEPTRAPTISVGVGVAANGSVPVTVTATRTTAAGTQEALGGVSVTLTGADFDPSVAGVQSKTIVLGANGAGAAAAVQTSAAQSITATAAVSVPAGSLLAVASDTGPASSPALQLQQLITARSANIQVAASGSIPASTGGAGATTTVPGSTTSGPGATVPDSLPYSGPSMSIVLILLSIVAGGAAVIARRRMA